jgi:Tol biopolymer transport system component
MSSRLLLISLLMLILLAPLSGQVVFSRRVYKEQGQSYQQIWNWNPADKSLRQLTDSPRNHYLPSCSGSSISFVSPEAWQENAKEWIFDRDTRSERIVGPAPLDAGAGVHVGDTRCDVRARAGPLEACGKTGEVTVSREGKQIGRLRVSPGPSAIGGDFPIESLAWSPSGKWLLVGTLGIDTSSSSPQSDFWVVDADSMKLTKAGSGNSGAWLPARDVFFYTSPRDLAPLGGARRPRGVWVEHLMTFDPASGKTTAITSGVTNNLQPSICGK